MPSLPSIGFFLLGALGLLLFPGPAVLYITARSASQGRRAGLVSVLGIELGSLTHAIAAALGLSALLLTSALAFSVVKYAGAAYLIYLGVRTILARQKEHGAVAPEALPYGTLCRQGFLVQLLNPKTALFFYAFLPLFVEPARGAVTAQIFVFGLLFVLLACCTDGLYAILGATVGRWLSRHAHFRSRQRYVTGGLYIALGVSAAIAGSERRHG
jgi:threonine/homoserine/homoserine lactone efflux protein